MKQIANSSPSLPKGVAVSWDMIWKLPFKLMGTTLHTLFKTDSLILLLRCHLPFARPCFTYDH